MPFCFSPWTNIDVSPMGDISPCCKFLTESYNQKFNISEHSVHDYRGSAFLQSVQQDFLTGQWPAGCTRCRIEEDNNIQSKRQLDFARWQQHYADYDLEQDGFVTASIAFGNTCNLTCITCSPYSSSRWRHEYQTIYLKDIKNFHFYKDNFVQDFVKSAPQLIHIDIPGGEPFLSGVAEQKALLQHYVDTKQAGNITLHYTTNVNKIGGLRCDNGTYKVVYFGVGPEQMSNAAVGRSMIQVSHDWFYGTVSVEEFDAYFNGTLGNAFPVPASDRVTIPFNDLAIAARLEVFDLTGRTVLTRAVAAGTTSVDLSIIGLSEGVYRYALRSEEGSSTARAFQVVR